jgi:DNA-binding GntR family transcriptional regulator
VIINNLGRHMTTHGTQTETAVTEIVAVLEQDVIFGRFLPKQRLYEDEFIVRFSTKRHIVRAALQELERKGIVERYPNRGAAVRYFSRSEVAALYELRVILHEAAARRIAVPADPQWLAELEAARDAHAAAVVARDLASVFQTNTLFHRKLFEGAGNPYLSEAIETSNAKTHGIRSHGLGLPALLEKARAEHFAMVDAVQAGDPEALVRLCIEHMSPARAFYEEKYCSVL